MIFFILILFIPFSLGQREQIVFYNSSDTTELNHEFHGFFRRFSPVSDISLYFNFTVLSTCSIGHYIFYDGEDFKGPAQYVVGRQLNCVDWPNGKRSHLIVGDFTNFEVASILIFTEKYFLGQNYLFFGGEFPVLNLTLNSLILTGEGGAFTIYSGPNFSGDKNYCIFNGPNELGTMLEDFEKEMGHKYTLRSIRNGCDL